MSTLPKVLFIDTEADRAKDQAEQAIALGHRADYATTVRDALCMLRSNYDLIVVAVSIAEASDVVVALTCASTLKIPVVVVAPELTQGSEAESVLLKAGALMCQPKPVGPEAIEKMLDDAFGLHGRILIVDGSQQGRDAYAGLIELGYDCDYASSASQADRMLEKRKYALVIHGLIGADETLAKWSRIVRIAIISERFPDITLELQMTDAGALMCWQKRDGVTYIVCLILEILK